MRFARLGQSRLKIEFLLNHDKLTDRDKNIFAKILVQGRHSNTLNSVTFIIADLEIDDNF